MSLQRVRSPTGLSRHGTLCCSLFLNYRLTYLYLNEHLATFRVYA